MDDQAHTQLADVFAEAFSAWSDASMLADIAVALLPGHAVAVMQLLGDVREGWVRKERLDHPAAFVVERRHPDLAPKTYVPVFVVSLGAAAAKETDDG